MIILNSFIVISSSICATAPISNAKIYNDINNNNEIIVDNLLSTYEIDNVILNENEKETYIKQRLLKFNEENDTLDNIYLNQLDKIIKEEIYYQDYKSIEEQYKKEETLINFEGNKYLINENYTKDQVSSNLIINNTYNEINHPSDSSNSSPIKNENFNPNDYKLPMYSYNEENMYGIINSKLDGTFFLGLIISSDACIFFYNKIVSFINNKVASYTFKTDDMLFQLIELLLCSAPLGIGALASQVFTYFNSVIESILALITTHPIFAFIILVVAIAIIYLLVNIFIAGYHQCGYAIGFKIHNLFNWEYFDGEI